MPGIPRSNGCINCRERKIRCDQAKPACLRCSSTSRCCKGYRKKETIFINCAAPEELKRHSGTEPHKRRKLSTTTTSPSPVSDFQDQYVSLFPHNYHHKPHDGTFTFLQQPFWEGMPEVADKSNAFIESLTEVNLAMIGSASPAERIAKQPFGGFSSHSPSSSDPLAPRLASYELWKPMDRMSMVHESLARRKPIFLAGQDWQQAPKSTSAVTDHLLEVVVGLPYLLEQCDAILQYPASDPAISARCIALLQNLSAMLRQLQDWYSHTQSSAQGLLYWQDSPSLHSQEPQEMPDVLFGPRLHFPELHTVQVLLLFWTSHSLIYADLERLILSSEDAEMHQLLQDDYPAVDNNSFGYGCSLQTSYAAKAVEFADLIMRSEGFCCDGVAGVQPISVPIWATRRVYEGRDEVKFRHCCDRSRPTSDAGMQWPDLTNMSNGYCTGLDLGDSLSSPPSESDDSNFAALGNVENIDPFILDPALVGHDFVATDLFFGTFDL